MNTKLALSRVRNFKLSPSHQELFGTVLVTAAIVSMIIGFIYWTAVSSVEEFRRRPAGVSTRSLKIHSSASEPARLPRKELAYENSDFFDQCSGLCLIRLHNTSNRTR